MKLLSYLHKKLLFTLQDVAEEMGNVRSAQTLLARYQRQGYVSRVRRGMYYVNNIASSLPETNKYQDYSSDSSLESKIGKQEV